jgi:starch-binding outer membrane protein, SusD/RagB family
MNMRTNTRAGGGFGPLRRGLSVLSLGLLVPLAGCDIDRLMNVDDPDVALPETLQDPGALPVVYAGVISDFQRGFVGQGDPAGSTGEGILLISAMLSDELYAAGTFPTRQEVSRRDIQLGGPRGTTTNANLDFAERRLHRARRSAENAAETFAAADRANDARVAEVLALAGFTYIFFGENYCSGVPFSEVPRLGGPTVWGEPTPTQAIFTRAIARFDAAAGVTGMTAGTGNLVAVGRGRALLNQGDFAGAAAAVAGVPTSYQYVVLHSENTTLQNNAAFHYGPNSGRYGVPNRLGGNGIPWLEHAAAGDSARVPTMVRAAFASALGNVRVQAKYPTRASPVVVASGIEARLIQAEAALAMGASNAYLPILNALRADQALIRAHTGVATASALPALTDPGTPAGRVDQLFEERALWMWLTAHRLGDMRRLVRQYGRAPAAVFPVGEHGWYPTAGSTTAVPAGGGGSFGTDMNLPLVVDEANNPLFNGCLDRAA